ncbi:MAG TPA: hypothetical protein K8V84_13920 [Nocardiopsis listeri]|uniref:hypothetical protein n=1 Tax=Nocardiopsis listeri TaxID=53440 RepID=UPI001DD110CD|nr:hypothetical protein [Nocardiopsis listeri]HJE59584.1 hypothetical protein [Nocardiopsis listeri]
MPTLLSARGPWSRLTAFAAVTTASVLLAPSAAVAEDDRAQSSSVEVIITDDGFYEVGEDVESLEAFLDENPEYADAVENPDGVGTLATDSAALTHGTLSIRTTDCTTARVSYSKASGGRITVELRVGQIGRLERKGGPRVISTDRSASFTTGIASIGNVQGRMHVSEQDTTFRTGYVSCR